MCLCYLCQICHLRVKPFGLLAPKNVLNIWIRNPEEGYSRNASCALILISVLLFTPLASSHFSSLVVLLKWCLLKTVMLISGYCRHSMYFVFLSSDTTYFDLILFVYTTYIDLIMQSYMTYIDLILSAYATFIDLMLSDTTYIAMIMSSYTTIIDLIMSSYMRYILTYYFLIIPQLLTWFCRLIWHLLTRLCRLVRHLLTKTSKRDKY